MQIMKAILKAAAIASAAGCFAQVQAGQSAVQKMLKPVIEHQCSVELKDSSLWKASTFLMTDRNKQQFQQEVCSCVGETALNDVPAAELAHAAVSAEAKNQLIYKAMLNTVKGCVIKLKR